MGVHVMKDSKMRIFFFLLLLLRLNFRLTDWLSKGQKTPQLIPHFPPCTAPPTLRSFLVLFLSSCNSRRLSCFIISSHGHNHPFRALNHWWPLFPLNKMLHDHYFYLSLPLNFTTLFRWVACPRRDKWKVLKLINVLIFFYPLAVMYINLIYMPFRTANGEQVSKIKGEQISFW